MDVYDLFCERDAAQETWRVLDEIDAVIAAFHERTLRHRERFNQMRRQQWERDYDAAVRMKEAA